jgi:Asp-tRNA(Asn)/Glu-tRNA(Gln) amidotransferase A subunit family amidase
LLIDDPLRERRELPATRAALERAQASLQARGIVVQSATLPPRFSEARRCWETILVRDIAQHHGADRDAHGDLMSERLRSIIDAGRAISDAEYQRAVAAAEVLRRDLCDLIAPDTIIAAPAVDDVAPAFSEATGPSQLQGLWTLVGFPAIAVPCGMVDGLPIGVQLIGAPGGDQPLLAAAALFTAHWPAV